LPEHEPYTDPNFGTAIWDDASGDWRFTLVFPSGRRADGSVRPEDNHLHLSSPEFSYQRPGISRSLFRADSNTFVVNIRS
jgi:hypothetical protein